MKMKDLGLMMSIFMCFSYNFLISIIYKDNLVMLILSALIGGGLIALYYDYFFSDLN